MPVACPTAAVYAAGRALLPGQQHQLEHQAVARPARSRGGRRQAVQHVLVKQHCPAGARSHQHPCGAAVVQEQRLRVMPQGPALI
eukprot:CAMPEP_0202920044 /NCGR_PEP_ID=MMETSP1392-20130828/76654_1 /ASSEMBLY_ACC=CAM_ASM_000868 /TAXON_ID=225041 /ORGANISM="Chlamydomonas chlamydogama, Strain SAG 11-48b" /LENGTH=84 /DNA_ID=CAMNT_0049613523 /DNA_START=487 /DNA_END=742 /DNA_ORIENTATION=-